MVGINLRSVVRQLHISLKKNVFFVQQQPKLQNNHYSLFKCLENYWESNNDSAKVLNEMKNIHFNVVVPSVSFWNCEPQNPSG